MTAKEITKRITKEGDKGADYGAVCRWVKKEALEDSFWSGWGCPKKKLTPEMPYEETQEEKSGESCEEHWAYGSKQKNKVLYFGQKRPRQVAGRGSSVAAGCLGAPASCRPLRAGCQQLPAGRRELPGSCRQKV